MTQTKAELLQTRHQGDIRLGDADSSHYVGFKAPATVGTSLVWTLPAADGTANYLLKTDGSGNLAWTADNSGVSLSGSTNNTIATVTGANALQGEATFTYNGTDTLEIQPASAAPAIFIGDSNRTGAGQHLAEYRGNWYGTCVGRVVIQTGDDTTNKDDGYITFRTASAGSTTERLRVGSGGQLGIGGANYGSSGQVLTSGGSGAAPAWADAAGGGATPTVKTANYTAASGDLVVVNGSGLTITLPSSPSVADSVEIRILGSRYCTVARNGSNIESTASNFYMDTFDGHTKFIYTDSTRGWLVA